MEVSRQQGFTLVELIVVIVILSIMAAFAIPKFINLTDSANSNSTNSIAAALATASTNNFAIRTASNGSKGSAISNCTQIAALLTSGSLPSASYSITSQSIAVNATATCVLNGPSGTSATFVGHGVS